MPVDPVLLDCAAVDGMELAAEEALDEPPRAVELSDDFELPVATDELAGREAPVGEFAVLLGPPSVVDPHAIAAKTSTIGAL